MTSSYSRRFEDFLYDIDVAEVQESGRGFQARASHVQRLRAGQLTTLHVALPQAYGATVDEAVAAMEASLQARLTSESLLTAALTLDLQRDIATAESVRLRSN